MKKAKIYIKIPSKAIAGGVESLYQLADAINNVGGNSIVLWDTPHNDPVPQKYKNYSIQHSTEVEDTPDNWIIYPEVWTEKLTEYTNLKKAIWWLSVDNNHGKFRDFSNPDIVHFYQSYYALEFLIRNRVEKCLPLFDYIPSKYTEEDYIVSQKQNIVCYNPVKGLAVTNQVKVLNPDIDFVAITRMEEFEIIRLLKSSKVYIDFGHHPGRDRIPREAAILGNCVITNTSGAAGFYGDLPLDQEFKLSDVNRVRSVMCSCLENFDSVIGRFSLYRSSIKNQKDQLHNLVKQYFI